MRIVLTGGGTGGHVMPILAVIEELKKKGEKKFLFLGSKTGIEKNIAQKYGIEYKGVSCGKLRRYFSVQNFFDFFKIPFGIFSAMKILKNFKPDIVFSKGGYVSVPSVVAAYLLKIPIVVHESDIVPGLSNKIGFTLAKKICLSFEESYKYLPEDVKKKTVLTGTPVRADILNGDEREGYKFTGFNRFRPIILVMGGSQGAEQINNLVRAGLDDLLKKYQIVHLVGRGNIDISIHKEGYKQYEFLNENLKDVFAVCRIVVSRGGANSLAEIACLKKSAIIIPLDKTASRGEQIENAKIFAQKFGWSVLSEDVSREKFIAAINSCFDACSRRVAPDENFLCGGASVNSLCGGASVIADIILNKGR